MADSASESDSSSIDGGPIMMPPSPVTREQLQKRIESLQQQNRVLKVELETYKLRVKALQEENRGLRQASVFIVSYKNSDLTTERIVDVNCYIKRDVTY
jgi:coiled-coil domain-containing protein 6